VEAVSVDGAVERLCAVASIADVVVAVVDTLWVACAEAAAAEWAEDRPCRA